MKLNPYIAVVIGAVIGGTSGVFIKLLNLPSTSITFFRLFVPVAILLVYFRWNKTKLFQGDYKIMLIASALNASRMFLYMFAYLHTSIGNAVILLYTWPFFATLYSVIFLKEKVSKRTMALLCMAFAGIIVMYSNKNISFKSDDLLGMGAMLLSAIIFSITAVIFKNKLKDYSEAETVFYQNFVGAIIFLPFIFINTPHPTLPQVSIASIYTFLTGIVVFSSFFYALKRIKMSHYSLLTYLEVPAAIVFSVIFFHEKITLNMVLGGVIIITAGLLLRGVEKSAD